MPLMSDEKVAERYDRCVMTIKRWSKKFPDFPVAVQICGRNYRDSGQLDAWDAAQLKLAEAAPAAKRGSIDAVTHADGELVDDLRVVQLVLSLEAAGRANGGAHRDYRLRGVALAHGVRPR